MYKQIKAKTAKLARGLRNKRWTEADLREIFFSIGMVSVFAGAWLIFNLGVSLTVCGSVFLYISLKSTNNSRE